MLRGELRGCLDFHLGSRICVSTSQAADDKSQSQNKDTPALQLQVLVGYIMDMQKTQATCVHMYDMYIQ